MCQEAVELVDWKIKVILLLPGLTARHKVVLSWWFLFEHDLIKAGLVLSSYLAILALKLCIAVHPSGFGIRQNLCLPPWRQAKCLGPNLWERPRQAPLAEKIQHIAPPGAVMNRIQMERESYSLLEKSTRFHCQVPMVPCFRMPRSQFVWAICPIRSYPITQYYWNLRFPANPPTPLWRWRHAYWGANSHTKCSITFVDSAVAISALAGGAPKTVSHRDQN